MYITYKLRVRDKNTKDIHWVGGWGGGETDGGD